MSADAATVRAAVQMIPATPAATTWRVCPPDLEPPRPANWTSTAFFAGGHAFAGPLRTLGPWRRYCGLT